MMSDIRTMIEAELKKLTYCEREIIKLRYGLTDEYTYTVEEVARIFRVTRERVRWIEKKGLVKLAQAILKGQRNATNETQQ